MRFVELKHIFIHILHISIYDRVLLMIALMVNLTKRNLSKFTNNFIHMAKRIIIASMNIIFTSIQIIKYPYLDMHFLHSMLIMMVSLISMNFF
jgi:hypothetical protein